MNTVTDEQYIKKTLEGEVNAFSFLVEKYQHMVFTLSYRIVKNREEAEEISQDVFVKSFSNLEKFEGKSKFSTWIYKIAYYASLDSVKRNKKKVYSENIDTIYEGDLGLVQDALNYLEDKERKQVIQDAILLLNEDERAILTLYYFEDLPVKEIAEIVNLSDDNIKVKLFRSRKKLYSILKNVVEPRTSNVI